MLKSLASGSFFGLNVKSPFNMILVSLLPWESSLTYLDLESVVTFPQDVTTNKATKITLVHVLGESLGHELDYSNLGIRLTTGLRLSTLLQGWLHQSILPRWSVRHLYPLPALPNTWFVQPLSMGNWHFLVWVSFSLISDEFNRKCSLAFWVSLL